MNVVLNPSLNASNLRGLQKQMDDGTSPLILVNCNLERLTFFDKLGSNSYLGGFTPAYVLKKVNNGFLFRRSHTAPWDTFASFQDGQMGPYLAQIDTKTGGARPKYLDVENKVKAAVAANTGALREAAEEAKQLNNKGRTAGSSKSPFW